MLSGRMHGLRSRTQGTHGSGAIAHRRSGRQLEPEPERQQVAARPVDAAIAGLAAAGADGISVCAAGAGTVGGPVLWQASVLLQPASQATVYREPEPPAAWPQQAALPGTNRRARSF